MSTFVGLATAALVLVLWASPIGLRQTGKRDLDQLTFVPERLVFGSKLWIDTDAACGNHARVDPDDCLAITLLAFLIGDQIAGISTVAGNATQEVVDHTTQELAARLTVERGRELPVHTGSHGLTAALEKGPLTIVALGPLTNVAAALDARPDLRSRVKRIVAIMGKRPGHIFHPSEGSGRGMFFGHGPIFRDFNFEKDMTAAASVMGFDIPVTLIPYDAAKRIEISAADLDRLVAAGGVAAWVAERSRGWLDFWQKDIGREGFSPFDLLAAAYVVDPQQFQCADVQVTANIGFSLLGAFGRTGLFVRQSDAHSIATMQGRQARYCVSSSTDIKSWLVEKLVSDRKRS